MNKLLLVGDIDVNCYFIERKGQCYIVDPGYEKERIRDYVNKRGLRVLGILLTHAHIDHVEALDCFNVPVYLHNRELPVFQDEYYSGYKLYKKTRPYSLNDIEIRELKHGDRLPLSDRNIEVIHTPGHTPGSVCYKVDSLLYTGDTLFKSSVGRWDFPLGDENALRDSIISLIRNHDASVTVCPGHGPRTTIGEERESNQFYMKWTSADQESV